MIISKTSRLDIRITPVMRGKLAELAGPYGSLAGVVRSILEQHFAQPVTNGKKSRPRTH